MRTIKIIFLLLLSGLSAMGQGKKISGDDMHFLASILAGEFSNAEFAKADSTIPAETLRLVPVWRQDTNVCWYYVEQARASTPEKPTRQQVYHLFRQDPVTAVIRVYDLNKPSRFTGGWKTPSKLENLKKEDLVVLDGCTMYFSKSAKDMFLGGTSGQGCADHRKGAAYSTLEIRVMMTKLFIWERGFNRENKQVWGREKAGILFRKEKNYDLSY